ncbi:MAG TPA: asparagine synthase-related protein [Chloroflexota bacterium]|nr:asparagine synthase-related protein [Chloroflexota bacterium]
MSGLAAIFHRDGRPAGQETVWEMLAAAPHRGPDGMHLRLFGPAALGHAKFAVTPEESEEWQPVVSPRTGCAIVCDARLDNRPELLAALPDRIPHTASDAELLLRAYEAWGLGAFARLLGDFALVVWDPRRLWIVCARDTSGQRALFYRVDGSTFGAASEIQQLLQDPGVAVEPDDERVRDYLVPLNISRTEKDHAATFYRGVSSLPAGHFAVVTSDSIRVERYWDLQPPREIRYRSEAQYAEHYHALFSEVVRARLRTAHPVGILLSGGLDSSSVACVAQEAYRAGHAVDHGFVGVSAVFDGLECDERTLVEDIQRMYDFPTKFVPFSPSGGSWLRPEPRGFQESPNMGAGEMRDALFGAAAAAGVRVLLSGEIADSCVGGSPYVFDSLLRQGRFRELWRRLRIYRRTSRESLRKLIALDCIGPLLPLAAYRHLRIFYARRLFHRAERNLLPIWMPDALRADLAQRHLRLLDASERERRFANPTRHAEYLLLRPPEVVRHPVPWPLESWRPFADRRLHEFLLAIPPEQKYEPHPDAESLYAGTKRLVRRSLHGVLPESIRTRTSKTHFGAVFETAVERQWPQFEATFGLHARPEIAARGYVEHRRFWRRLELLRAGVTGGDFMYLMHMVGLETWLRALLLPRPQRVTVPPPLGATAAPRRIVRPSIPAALHI